MRADLAEKAKKAAKRRALVVELRGRGVSFRAIAKVLGISVARAYQLYQDAKQRGEAA
jgi:transposase